MNSMKYDVVVIGGGVIGCAVARELSRYQLKTCVVEREEDVCSGTSKANSAIVHGGFDAEPGSLKAKFNIQGSRMMEELSEELDFEYKRNGSLVLCFAEEDKSGRCRHFMKKACRMAWKVCLSSAEMRRVKWNRILRIPWLPR